MFYTIATQNIKHVLTLSLLSLAALLGAVFAAPSCYAVDGYPSTVAGYQDYWNVENLSDYITECQDSLYTQFPSITRNYDYIYVFVDNGANAGSNRVYTVLCDAPIDTIAIYADPQYVCTTIDDTTNPFKGHGAYISAVSYNWADDVFTPTTWDLCNQYNTIPFWRVYALVVNYQPTTYTPQGAFLVLDASASSVSEVVNYSDINLFSGFYDITFEPLAASNDSTTAQKFLNHSYPCYLTGVLSDNGFNMASIQCPALAESVDTCFYGIVSFNKSKGSAYSFDDFTLSFTTDLPSDADIIAPDADDYPLLKRYDGSSFVEYNNVVSMTVNSMRFINNSNTTVSYSMRELSSIDYRASSSSYDGFVFYCSINSNIYSSGSFVYNFTYSDVKNNGTSLDELDKDDVADEGKKKNAKTKKDYAYFPRYNTYNPLNDSFDWNDSGDYDFSIVSDLLGWFFENSFILTLVTACCVVGLVGYVLYGKRG